MYCWVEPQYNIEQVENTWPLTRHEEIKKIFWFQTTLMYKKYLEGQEREKINCCETQGEKGLVNEITMIASAE